MTILRKAGIGLIFAGMLGLASAANAAPVANGGQLQEVNTAAAGFGLVTKVHGCHGWSQSGWVEQWHTTAFHHHVGHHCRPKHGTHHGFEHGGGYRHHGRPHGHKHGCFKAGPVWICP